jgi:hypothetical protein
MSAWLVCRTCGKHVSAASAFERAWCSEECSRTWSVCITCGRYFVRGKGYDPEHCSRDCTVRYQIVRKYGPEPVTVVTEV